MKVTKPNWVEHSTEEKKSKNPIYSLSVHPDGTRLATGGQDNKVKIWSTLPILDASAAEDEANHKLLCTMSAHNGPVLTVRWAHHGRYLASGSDDSVILIWDIDPAGGGRVFGSEEVNVENWKALRRLVGHVADVVDIAWSRDDAMLASVGLDSKIIIWDGYTFERLRTIDAHQGFVKGVTWDPVGNFLATQSDDKTVRIWDTESWQCVEKVSRPFEMSPQSTFFRRLSWSPDGAFIAASNAMNGPVFVAAVIEREGWQSDISFVGHQNTIQVAAFNPCLFFSKDVPANRVNASCMVALGADDFTISIWRNTMHKPLVVLRDIFARQILDLCWANDGLALYGCSADGTMCAVQFSASEFPELATHDMTQKILNEYGYKSSQRRPPPQRLLSPAASFSAAPASATEQVNILVPRKAPPKDRRRINLQGTMTGTAMSNGGSSMSLGGSGGRAPLQRPVSSPTRGSAIDAFSRAADEPLSTRSGSDATMHMLRDARGLFDRDSEPRTGEKRKGGDLDDGGRTPKGRNLGVSRPLGAVKEIRAPRIAIAGGGGAAVNVLPVPSIQSVLRVQQEEGAGVFSAENAADDSGHNSLTFSQGSKDMWLDFVPSASLAIVASSSFCAAAGEDGTVRVYSTAGRHLSSVKLPAPVSEMAAGKDMLMILTADSMVRVLDTHQNKALHPPTSISHLLNPPSTSSNPTPAVAVTAAMMRPNGCPVIITSEPAAWAFDADMGDWTQIAAPWWLSSPLSEVRTRNGRSTPSGSPLAEIEQRVASSAPAASTSERPKWWDEALSIGHYETRLRGARLLDSKEEYRHWLREYARFLGEENFRERAEELVSELMGPVYYLPNKPGWQPKLLGIPKRDLAKDALKMMSGTVALAGFANERLNTLKSIQTEEAKWRDD